MGFSETIKKIKEISNLLQSKNIADREVIHYSQELHRHINNLEVPQLIGQEDDNISRNILHN
jgi:hypothetical protein|tara:strand:- start:5 stop:190 length:186 start_codon:yes stop_codon:yes gene_type:complete